MKRKNNKFIEISIAFILGMALGIYGQNPDYFTNLISQKSLALSTQIKHYNISELSRSKVSTCFTPPAGCTKFIANQIDKAEESIYMQAYGMSDALITTALINAQARGVKVRILLDRSNLKQKFSKLHELQRAKIDVGIDKVPGIAHNKVIIIDKKKVITGSFNFTAAADKRNAENVIIIEDQELAESYLQNWLNRKASN
ncbi:phospholipase D [Rickettsia conorii subsp. heilongjiangensis]|uniref:Phospholipase D n=1 Tax=Rickettsia conorii subsp. heilongjiangensis TaxID=226665 RepID=A0AAD1GJT9_RICCR|nr:phospholipase D family protein [Rickettsia conorii]AEK75230.1 phospholipase D superfamily protein PLD [Rickettsia conorii subsp. heilongjiangensis 054]BBM91962.1 phospholipase D [Rickettsia conorii subsp. heilongjiangensis]BBM93171.1 phospholipase D [Rickettsia conorii subsp. heilongjiangensis]BBM94380.1 phospholipase D [Rickettsia conorii subsp. heilongjiangensis]BBM95589.1 phospholipase D [Rickettsia conorii subsp. heilongjiangensis]